MLAQQQNLRACGWDEGQHALHLARADHAGLVDHQHVARGEKVAALRPAMFHAGDGARRDARSVLKPFGGDAGQRCAAHLIPCALPCFARNAKHRVLAGARIAHHHAKLALARHMLERSALFARQRKPARFRAHQCRFARLLVHAMPLPLGHQFRCALQPLFRLDHLA